jgi:urea-proton symporter
MRLIFDPQRSLATNIIVSSMLILGGSATVTDLTGMSTIAVRLHLSYSSIVLIVLYRLVS